MGKLKKLILLPSVLILLFVFAFCNKPDINSKPVELITKVNDSVKQITKVNNTVEQKTSFPAGLRKLVKAYPDFLDSADENHLYWKDGTKMIYDDGIEKDFEEMLDNASLKDQMSQEYLIGEDFENPPPENFDPGRIRNEEFFRKMYGNSSGEAQSNLVNISWMPKSTGQSVKFTSVNGACEQLRAVSSELDNISSDLKKYVTKLGGTFYWRVIAGTNRLSMHSFGIAIDINVDYSNYWLWESGKKGKVTYRNKIPIEIVKIFEKYGFIWGGKWYHYDTMHFEYRPELLISLDE